MSNIVMTVSIMVAAVLCSSVAMYFISDIGTYLIIKRMKSKDGMRFIKEDYAHGFVKNITIFHSIGLKHYFMDLDKNIKLTEDKGKLNFKV